MNTLQNSLTAVGMSAMLLAGSALARIIHEYTRALACSLPAQRIFLLRKYSPVFRPVGKSAVSMMLIADSTFLELV